jgi:VanZ family protein
MWRDRPQFALRDRHNDPAPTSAVAGKPAVLRRSTIRLLCAASLLVIVYGTLGPLGVRSGPWLRPVDNWTWVLPWQHSTPDDVFTNFVVYVPVGIAFRLLVRRRSRAGAPDFVVGLMLSTTLSYLTEVGQQFMPARSASLTDWGVNTVGALFGCLIAPRLQGWLRRTHVTAFQARQNDSWSLLAWAATSVTAGLMLLPPWLAAPHFDLSLTRRLDLEDVKRFSMLAVVGFTLTAAFLRRTGSPSRAAWSALIRTTLMVMALELMQICMAYHRCGLVDALIEILGGASGIAAAMRFADLGLLSTAGGSEVVERELRWVGWAALSGTMICVFVVAAKRLLTGASSGSDMVVAWTPFGAEFMRPFPQVVDEVLGTAGLYGLLSLLCLLLAPRRGRAVALLVVLGLAGLLESFRAALGRGPADTTPILLAFIGWVLTVRIWNGLIPGPRRAYGVPVANR